MKDAEEAEPEPPPAADAPPAPPGPGPGVGAEGWFSTPGPPSWLPAGAPAVFAVGHVSLAAKLVVEVDAVAASADQPPASSAAIDAPIATDSQLACPSRRAEIIRGNDASDGWSCTVGISDGTRGAIGVVATIEASGAASSTGSSWVGPEASADAGELSPLRWGVSPSGSAPVAAASGVCSTVFFSAGGVVSATGSVVGGTVSATGGACFGSATGGACSVGEGACSVGVGAASAIGGTASATIGGTCSPTGR